jgi:ribosomal protein S18 acetylase RimI-like enzyme
VAKAPGLVQVISPEQTHALRHSVLRPNQGLADCAYSLDHAQSSFHVGYVVNDRVVGVGSLFQESPEGEMDPGAWRIRGMAVLPECRGQGIGGFILEALIAHARCDTIEGEIWCNGRLAVKEFYERYGFRQVAEVFDLPPIGPHVVLSRSLAGGGDSL